MIVGALDFRNEYDGHTLPQALEQVIKLTGKILLIANVDRGYRGNSQIGYTKIYLPFTIIKTSTSTVSQKIIHFKKLV